MNQQIKGVSNIGNDSFCNHFVSKMRPLVLCAEHNVQKMRWCTIAFCVKKIYGDCYLGMFHES
jgi:hypothetical protein